MWKQISVLVACGLVAACGGGSSGSDSSSALPGSLNNVPQIVGTPTTTARVDQAYLFEPSASDADGDTLTFRIENQPEWATFSSSTGRLEGTPPGTAKPVYSRILISVSDGKAFSDLPAFDLTVLGLPASNTAPTIGGTPAASVVAGNSYEFLPQVSDPDGQTLTFSISGKPAWASFSTSTGRLSGTPTSVQVGSYSGIVISVSDGTASASLPSFAINVVAANQSPVISGTPATSVTAGLAYSFTPTASDPDGQTLTFSISGKPAWASFSTSTGRLSGTPTAAQVGSYSGIVISVSDGTASVSVPSFTIAVTAATSNTAELAWTAPTTNEDGSALTDLAGYKIRYGTSANSLAQAVDVAGAAITSASIEGLSSGTWYFSLTSYKTGGVESAPTGTVYVTFQ